MSFLWKLHQENCTSRQFEYDTYGKFNKGVLNVMNVV